MRRITSQIYGKTFHRLCKSYLNFNKSTGSTLYLNSSPNVIHIFTSSSFWQQVSSGIRRRRRRKRKNRTRKTTKLPTTLVPTTVKTTTTTENNSVDLWNNSVKFKKFSYRVVTVTKLTSEYERNEYQVWMQRNHHVLACASIKQRN